MKRLLLILISCILAACTFTGCQKKEENYNAVEFLTNVESYSCNFDMNILNSRQKLEYSGKQDYGRDGTYNINLDSGRSITFKDDKIYIQDIPNSANYVTDQDIDNLLHLSVIGEYIELLYNDDSVNTEVKTINNRKCSIVKVLIPGGNRNLNTACLYLDYDTNVPQKLLVYDVNNKNTVSVNYKNFVLK